MKTKLEMAHEWYMKHSESPSFMYTEVEQAWQYADAMQAEADKRENKDQPKASNMADSPELDDCDHHWKELQDYKICKICNKKQGYIPWDKWQPDWSQAPEWANWWTITKYGQGHWFLSEPKVIEESWVRGARECKQAPSFNYQGDWRDSLRKRPQ